MIKINKRGVVSKVEGDRLEVLMMRSSACGDCSSCGGCETKSINLDLKNDIDANVGDFVELEYKSSLLLKGTLLVYLFPLIMLVLGVVIGYTILPSANANKDLFSFLIGLVLMAVAYLVINRIDRKFRDNNYISIKKVDELI